MILPLALYSMFSLLKAECYQGAKDGVQERTFWLIRAHPSPVSLPNSYDV